MDRERGEAGPAEATFRGRAGDPRLVVALRTGDEAVIAEIVDSWSSTMLRLARTYARSDAVAEEVVQESWMAVLKGVARFEGRSSLKSWVLQIVANRARTIAAREARNVPFSDLAEDDDREPLEASELAAFAADGTRRPGTPAPAPEAIERLAESAEFGEAFEKALADLTARERAVAVLCDVEGVPPGDVCNALGIQETNRRVVLHRARMKLRRRLRAYAPGGETKEP